MFSVIRQDGQGVAVRVLRTTMNQKAKVFFIISVVAFGLVWLAGTWHPDWDYKKQYASFTESMARAVPPSFRYEPLNATEKVDPETEELLKVLLKRLQRYTGPKLEWTKYVCHKYVENIAPCYDTTCPGQFSPSLRTRLKQVLATRSPIPAQYLQALASAAQSVTPHKYIFATGTSSNHFREMELFLHTALTSLLPRMEGKDFALLVYDLGLTTEQRERLQKICRCTVLDFPFSGLPDFVSELKCYTWKPLIIASLLEKAEYLTWADSSIRFRDSDPFPEMFQKARENGFQSRYDDGSVAVRTKRPMADFFGDELCQHSAFTELEANFMVFYNDRFTREAVMKPWISCALNRTCMCLSNFTDYLSCNQGPPERVYERCHRFDQSAINFIFTKLYLENRPMLQVRGNMVKIARGTSLSDYTAGDVLLVVAASVSVLLVVLWAWWWWRRRRNLGKAKGYVCW